MAASTSVPELTRKQRQLVKTAARLFDLKGYANASVDDIAEAVGIRKPTVYHHFESKAEILFLVHHQFMEAVLPRAEAHLVDLTDGRVSASEALLVIINDIVDLMRTHPAHLRVFFEHHRELAPRHRKIVRAQRDRYEEIASKIISRGIQGGEFREVNIKIATLGILGMCNWAYQWYKPKGLLSTSEVGEIFGGLVLRGLGGAEPPRPTQTTPTTRNGR